MFDFINPWAYARKAREKRQKEQQALDQIKRDALAQRLKNIAAAEQKRRNEAAEQRLTLVRGQVGLTAKDAAIAERQAHEAEVRRRREIDEDLYRRTHQGRNRADDEERESIRRNSQADDSFTYGPFSAGAPGHAPSHAPSTHHCAPSDTGSSHTPSSSSASPSSSDSSCSSSSDSGSSGGGSGD